jgi:hypothetical protein
MKKIILASYMIRYPLGGMISYVLQYLLGFQRLGYDVYFVEKANYHNACFDVSRMMMTDDPSYGVDVVERLLNRFGMGKNWCYIDVSGNYFGMSNAKLRQIFQSSSLFIDMGVHGSLAEEAKSPELRVLIDGEPAYTQMKMENGTIYPDYDVYFTNGMNIGLKSSSAPTAGIKWRHIYHPVVVDLYEPLYTSSNKHFSTIMNWQSHKSIEYKGVAYGQKDIEFVKFMELPKRINVPFEIAVYGKETPAQSLIENGWILRSAHQITYSYDSFNNYVTSSMGEFSVCKNVFVSTNSGWFSDRSAVYLAMGKPVVLQETGFSEHLPVGEGLFAVETVEEAEDAINEIISDPKRHSRAARNIAVEYLDTEVVLKRFLSELGV